MGEKRRLVLPRSPPVDAVLDRFVAERRKSTGSSAVVAEGFAKRVRAELRGALGTKLLYSVEREEFERLRKQAKGVAPAEHTTATAATSGVAKDTHMPVSSQQQTEQAGARVKQPDAMDVLIGQTYGAQHLLRLLVAVPSLRSISSKASPAVADMNQPTPGSARESTPAPGSSPRQQQQQSKDPAEVEHFIQFLASHTGASGWLGDAVAYAAAMPGETEVAEQDGVGKATQAKTAAKGKSSKPSDWRERARSFLQSADSDL